MGNTEQEHCGLPKVDVSGEWQVKQVKKDGVSFSPKKIVPHKLFDIQIKDKLFEVWHRDEKHNIGTLNGSSYEDNMWVKYFDTWISPTCDPLTEITWVPWHDWNGNNKVCFEIRIKQSNYVKHKYDEYSIRGTGICEIICNTRKVYEFYFGDINYAFACAQKMIMEMKEHFFDFKNPEKEIGRKIWYKRQPAIIDHLIMDQGCIVVKKEDGTNFMMTDPWYNGQAHMNEWMIEKEIKVDIFDNDIYWFRPEGE